MLVALDEAIMTDVQLIFEFQMFVLNEDSLLSAVNWMTIANNALYTAIDSISQFILVSVPNTQFFLD